jgi:hypothetical protein
LKKFALFAVYLCVLCGFSFRKIFKTQRAQSFQSLVKLFFSFSPSFDFWLNFLLDCLTVRNTKIYLTEKFLRGK